jgi:hypothetical protein
MTEPDPRTDGWDEELEQELPPPSDDEVQAGVEHDRARAVAADDSDWVPE